MIWAELQLRDRLPDCIDLSAIFEAGRQQGIATQKAVSRSYESGYKDGHDRGYADGYRIGYNFALEEI